MLSSVLSGGLAVLGILERGKRNALDLAVREWTLCFDNLPPAFDSFSILFMSDLHIDGAPELAPAIAEVVGGVEADLCILGGDYCYELDGPGDGVLPGMRTLLDAVHSRQGVVAVLGNHDYLETGEMLEEMGVRLLLNEPFELTRGSDSVWVVGLDDPHFYGCDDLPGALEGVPRESFKILVVHTPEMIREAQRCGFNLYLAGHTHGGQIRLPWIGAVVIKADCARRHSYGPWEFRGMAGYTSGGAGCSMLPVRFNCPPEVLLLRLKRGTLDAGRSNASESAEWRRIARKPKEGSS